MLFLMCVSKIFELELEMGDLLKKIIWVCTSLRRVGLGKWWTHDEIRASHLCFFLTNLNMLSKKQFMRNTSFSHASLLEILNYMWKLLYIARTSTKSGPWRWHQDSLWLVPSGNIGRKKNQRLCHEWVVTISCVLLKQRFLIRVPWTRRCRENDRYVYHETLNILQIFQRVHGWKEEKELAKNNCWPYV